MTSATIPPTPITRRAARDGGCGGARILDLALCMILAVTVVGLLMLAL